MAHLGVTIIYTVALPIIGALLTIFYFATRRS